MKEKNLYTMSLAAVGVLSLLLSVYAFIEAPDPLDLLGKVALLSVLVIFHVQIPLKFAYSFDQIAYVYLLIQGDWRVAGIIILSCVLSIIHRDNQKRFSLFRVLLNVGFMSLSFVGFIFIPYFNDHPLSYLELVLLLFLIDLTSLLINKSIHIIVLGRSVIQLPQLITLKYTGLFFFFSTLIAYRLVQQDDLVGLFHEVIFLAVILFIFSHLCKITLGHIRQAEDSQKNVELGFTSMGQFVIETTNEGTIREATMLGLQVLGLDALDKTAVHDIRSYVHPEYINEFSHAYELALDGQTREAAIRLGAGAQNRSTPLYELHFIPCIRNMKLEGVMIIGKERCSGSTLHKSNISYPVRG